MRAPIPLGAAFAGSLLGRANAQSFPQASGYGNSNGGPNGIPESIPNGYGTLGPAANSGSPSGEGSGSNGPSTCGFVETTTVFVTVYPTSPVGSAAALSSAEAVSSSISPFGSPAAETTQLPQSGGGNPLATVTSVTPFTTITIDIWGTGSASGGGFGQGSNNPSQASGNSVGGGNGLSFSVPASASAPAYTGPGVNPLSFSPPSTPASASNGLPGGIPGQSGQNTPSSFPDATPYGNPGGAGQQSNSGLPLPVVSGSTLPNGESPYTVVTSISIDWTAGPSGLSQVTVMSPQTISFGGLPSGAPESEATLQSSPAYQSNPNSPGMTVLGPNGESTVISAAGIPTGGNGQGSSPSATGALPFPGGITLSDSDTMASAAAASGTLAPGLGGSGSGSGLTTCTRYTILGPDGSPTVIETSWLVSPATALPNTSGGTPAGTVTQDSLSGFPTLQSGPTPPPFPPASASGEGGSPFAGQTTCITVTEIGPDSLPTIVESSVAVSATQSALGASGIPLVTVVPDASGILPSGFTTLASGVGTPDQTAMTTCVSYTIMGPNGSPTVIESTYIVPIPLTPAPAPTAGSTAGEAGTVMETCYTVIGPDGEPTVIDTTVSLPGPTDTGAGAPYWTSSVLATDATPLPATGISATGIGAGITTETCYTITGPDGQTTTVEATVVLPLPSNTQGGLPGYPSAASSALATGIPGVIPGQVTPFSITPSQSVPGLPGSDTTTCISFTVIGPNGVPTVVESTLTLAASSELPAETSVGLPPFLSPTVEPSISQIPQDITPFPGSGGPFTTCTTAVILGPNGLPTTVVETILLPPPLSTGTALAASAVPPFPSPNSVSSDLGTDTPSFGAPTATPYGDGEMVSGLGSLVPPVFSGPSGAESSVDATYISGTVTGTWILTSTLYIPNTGPGSSVQYSMPLPTISEAPGYGEQPFPSSGSGSSAQNGPIPSEITLWPASGYDAGNSPDPTPAVQTSTWTNVIDEETTTYTFAFPLTTLATIQVPPAKRLAKHKVKRQQSPTLSMSWSNSSTPTPTGGAPGATSTMCAAGGEIGNTTVTFENLQPGPLFNPTEEFWFSEGFLVAPPSALSPDPYIPTSGGQVVEFVPPALSSPNTNQVSGDTAEIGVGPNSVKSCFRFDFYGASLGCAALPSEEWCEFDISAYAYDPVSSQEQPISWSETKRIPACPTFPNGPCTLTPVDLDGYTNITSLLITMRVGLDLRVWWGDDFRFGWTDNSCAAASCRAGSPPQRVKRETVETALRRGVWKWTPSGLERLNDDYVLEARH